MLYLAFGGIAAICALAVVVGVFDARNTTRWRAVAAERRRAWEATQLRDDYPTGPQPLAGRR